MPELLAPAGDMDALRAAVQNGANAVYVGGKAFNARAFANNFDWDELARAADYCHLRGVLLYGTLNTMMLEGEIEEGVRFARQAYLSGADALIVADMGLARAIGQCCPGIPLHASTQMCVHNTEGARLAAQMGFKRTVLARELSLSDIREITRNSGTETEVFVHGALCSSVSGLCLLSSFIGGRSGNRGKCAQPCRLEYEINGKSAYHLSMADLCTAEFMQDLIAAGVSSFKIEGRMKNSAYVGGVVREYRRIIDAALEGRPMPQDSVKNLNGYYNRTFTNAYLTGGTGVTAIDKPGNRNIDKERTDETKEDGHEKTFYTITAKAELTQGKLPVVELEYGAHRALAVGDALLDQAKKPLDQDIVVRSIGKTGGTPFQVGETKVSIKGNPFISVSALNGLRKKAVEALEDEMLSGYHARACEPCTMPVQEEFPHALREVYVQTASVQVAVQSIRQGASRVYFSPDVYNRKTLAEAEIIYSETGVKPYIALPPFLREADMRLLGGLLTETHTWFGGALAGNFSQIALLKKYFGSVIADYTCNIANRQAMRAYQEMGFAGAALSAELNKKDINAIKGCIPIEMVAFGALPLMWLAHPLPAVQMRDRREYTYEIQKVKVHNELFAVKNPVLLAVREIASVRHSVDAVRLILPHNGTDVPDAYIRAVREGSDAEIVRQNTTQGHLKRGV